MLKIIGGTFRSRGLASPPGGEVTRPYPHRVKESLFNLLRGWWEGARVVDLFAGVGSIGLEAVSRGASRVMMVESDRGILRLLEGNIDRLGCREQCVVVEGDALGEAAMLRAPEPVDILSVDPPYAFIRDEVKRQRMLGQMGRWRSVMADRSFLVLRSPLDSTGISISIDGFQGPEVHGYGKNMFLLLYMPLPLEEMT